MDQAAGYFIGALVLVIVAFCFVGVTVYIKRDERYFKEHFKETTATLAGFRMDRDPWHRYPVVTFEDKGSVQKVEAHAVEKCYPDYPIGTPIRIQYCERRVMGIMVYDVRVIEAGYEPFPTQTVVYVMRGIWISFMVLAFGVIALGVRAILLLR